MEKSTASQRSRPLLTGLCPLSNFGRIHGRNTFFPYYRGANPMPPGIKSLPEGGFYQVLLSSPINNRDCGTNLETWVF